MRLVGPLDGSTVVTVRRFHSIRSVLEQSGDALAGSDADAEDTVAGSASAYSVARPSARKVCALASVRSRRRDAAFEQLFEPLLVYRHLLGSLPARHDCKQLADAVTLEVELEVHA